jgi:predicted permease
MRWISKIRLRWRSVVRRTRVERELDEEMQYHLEELVEHYVATGMSLPDARERARVEMGPIALRKEECRDARGVEFVDSVRQDVTYALRALRKSPGFTTVAVLSLAIGIGANTTIFTLVNSVLLTPLPYPNAERLVVLHEHKLNAADALHVHPINYAAWRARARSFDALALVQMPPLNVMGRDGAEQLSRMLTTPELFDVFGVRPALGRAFTQQDGRPGNDRVVILGYGFWQRWFGGDPGVLGRQLTTPDGSLTIIGVGPPGFRVGLAEPEAFTPMTIDEGNAASSGSRSFDCYGRLAARVSVGAAQAELSTLASTLRRAYPVVDDGMDVFVSGLHDYLVKDARPGLRLLMAVVAVVLAIACVNLAGLLLARGLARRGEFAVRVALGAGRGRLVRQLVVESLLLSLAGGVLGVAMAFGATRALVTRTAGALAVATPAPIQLDARCLLFTLAVSTVTALAFGLLPAWQASRVDPQSVLREQTRRATGGRRQFRVREVLVIAEVALAVVLLVGAGLLMRSLTNLSRVKLGFEPTGTLTMRLFLGVKEPAVRIALLDRILDRVAAVPGVKAAGTIQFLPLRGMNCGTGFWLEEEAARHDSSRTLSTDCALVSRGYFAAMGIPVLGGRAFDRRDRMGSSHVVMVNEAFARRYFADGHALGRRILVQWEDDVLSEIIGVVSDVHHDGLTTDPAPTVFLLHAQQPGYITNLVVRTSANPLTQAGAIVRAIHEVDPTQGVSGIGLIEQDVRKVLSRPRLHAGLVTSFAIIAVVLALIGIYGLLAYVVRLRTHEIGIRLAVGATRERIFGELFSRGAQLVAAGLVMGLGVAVALRSIASTFVFGITTTDPVSYAAATAAFLVAACAAIIIPARRAAHVEPMTALRLE